MSPLGASRATELLDRAAGLRVLVVGDIMLDRYVSGRVERVSPEAPVPVVLIEEERHALGGAGNVAANITALGAECALVGCVGDDPEGELLRTELERARVDASGVIVVGNRPTTVKTRVHAKPQQIVRLDREVDSDVPADAAQALASSIRSLARSCHAVVLQDYDKGVLTTDVIAAAMEAAAAVGLPIVVDPKRRAFFCYAGATVFKPNRRELEDAVGESVLTDDAQWMEVMRQRLGCAHLLVTLGARGMALQTDEARLALLPAAAREVYDVSGAGDTVSATVALALAAGANVLEAAALANHAASAGVERPGVRTVTANEITAQMVRPVH